MKLFFVLFNVKSNICLDEDSKVEEKEKEDDDIDDLDIEAGVIRATREIQEAPPPMEPFFSLEEKNSEGLECWYILRDLYLHMIVDIMGVVSKNRIVNISISSHMMTVVMSRCIYIIVTLFVELIEKLD